MVALCLSNPCSILILFYLIKRITNGNYNYFMILFFYKNNFASGALNVNRHSEIQFS